MDPPYTEEAIGYKPAIDPKFITWPFFLSTIPGTTARNMCKKEITYIPALYKLFDEGLKNVLFTSDYFLGKYVKKNLHDKFTNEVFLKSGSSISQEDLDKILEYNIEIFQKKICFHHYH